MDITDATAPATDPALADVLDALIAREPLFHRPEFGTARADFERMIANDYREVGASGRRYDRQYVLDVLEQRHRTPHHDRWQTRDFRCRELAGDVFLLTYTLQQEARISRRMTLWQRTPEGWRALYHQGTLVREDVS